MNTNILIIGTGIAGLKLAYDISNLNNKLKITIFSKNSIGNSNSSMAQGGIAVTNSQNEKNLHLTDTLKCGVINNNKAVKNILFNADHILENMINKGLEFDKDPKGHYSLRIEGGHSSRRILHKTDSTGKYIVDFLIKSLKSKSNVEIKENTYAYELICENNSCNGAKIIDERNNTVFCYFADQVIIASGGCGALYKYTTNKSYSIGDGIALAKMAGAELSNMEFIQFHPTVYTKGSKTLLLSEALRGEGAKICDENGNPIEGINELETRDKLARALFKFINNGNKVFLDCRHIPMDKLLQFKFIYESLKKDNLDMKEDLIPISPAAHYLCGGIKTNIYGKTSIENLYAIGECADSGFHGANRLASNSLTEAITIPYFLSKKMLHLKSKNKPEINNNSIEYGDKIDLSEKKEVLKSKMWESCGIVRDYNSLNELNEFLKTELNNLNTREDSLSRSQLEYRNMLICSSEIVRSSIKREENIGTYFNEDLT